MTRFCYYCDNSFGFVFCDSLANRSLKGKSKLVYYVTKRFSWKSEHCYTCTRNVQSGTESCQVIWKQYVTICHFNSVKKNESTRNASVSGNQKWLCMKLLFKIFLNKIIIVETYLWSNTNEKLNRFNAADCIFPVHSSCSLIDAASDPIQCYVAKSHL